MRQFTDGRITDCPNAHCCPRWAGGRGCYVRRLTTCFSSPPRSMGVTDGAGIAGCAGLARGCGLRDS
eukprot:11212412-Lingulodinium_polyedra.AAC.1